MAEAYIIDAVRTPVGKRGGGLSQVHSADLGAHAIRALVARTGVDPGAVEDVIFGCCDTIGPQAGDIARTCWLAAGLPEHVPGVTIDRQCGSSQQAVHFAAQAVMSGTSDLVVAGGVQNMSAIPISSAMTLAQPLGFETPFKGSKGWEARYGTQEVSQFRGAEMIAEKWGISREDMEAFASRATGARSARSTRGASPARSRRSATCRATRGRAATPAWSAWRSSSPSRRAVASRRRWPARSRTAPRRCWSPPSAR